MSGFLYNFVVTPIELAVEIIYSFFHRLLNSPGVSIIAVSLVIQTLVLPMYKRADAIQEDERARQRSMSKWVEHIKKTFTGDEKYMMLTTYYREQGYRSWYAIRSSVSLLLQIPFFMAAYHFLSNLTELIGQSFLFIQDLSKPDAVFSIYGFNVNILPVIMTVANIISGYIYTRDSLLREKIQVYGFALVFLVLLYNSPSGLVLYWTMNNLYSLAKNVVMKLIPRSKKKRSGNGGFVSIRKRLDDILPDISKAYSWDAIFLTLFLGAFIPLNIIRSSPSEFVNHLHGPMYLVFSNLTVFAGIFLLWGRVFLNFMNDTEKEIFTLAMFAISGIAVADYMFFGNKLGNMSPLLVYDNGLSFSSAEIAVNLVMIIMLIVVLLWLFLHFSKSCTAFIRILTVSAIILCVYNVVPITKQVAEFNRNKNAEQNDHQDEKVLHLSRDGKNVIVFMLDRAIDGYVPFILNEKPELADVFKDFTWYPNTISHGTFTNYGTPGLFGGYEYTPWEMNKRSDMSLKDKHNEALLLMPVLFSESGYDVTICDPPYAGNYSQINDLSLYDQYDNIRAYNLKGLYSEKYYKESSSKYEDKQRRVMLYHCIMKTLPLVTQGLIYNNGTYVSKSSYSINKPFWDAYSVLDNLVNITEISSGSENCFIAMTNNTTHDISLLKLPEYVPSEDISVVPPEINSAADNYMEPRTINGVTLDITNQYQAAHYQCNVAAYQELAVWFRFLKDNDCWDNTRIILVADHGRNLRDLTNLPKLKYDVDVEWLNPLLLVKDFNMDQDEYAESKTFMTNADVPTLAFADLIDDPVNPFTGKEVNSKMKEQTQYVTTSPNYNVAVNNGNVFDTSDGVWYEVTPGDISDISNWKVYYDPFDGK